MRAGALAFAVIATLGSAAGFAPKVFAQADEPLVATASDRGRPGRRLHLRPMARLCHAYV